MVELLDARSQKQQRDLDELNQKCGSYHETNTIEIQSNEKESAIQGDTQKIQNDLRRINDNVKGIREDIKNTKPAENKVKTFAEIMQSSTKSTVILKPKNAEQSSSATKIELQKKITPTDIPISNMRNISRGGIIIECNDKQASEKLIKKVTEKMQNAELEHGYIKVVSYAENKQKNGFYAIIQVDGEIFQNLMKNQKIFVGWQRCSVYECIDILRCYNCSGFHHKASDCKKTKYCPRCSQVHELKECDSTVLCCPNCTYAVNTYKLNLKTDHEAWSHDCATYLKKLDMQRGKIAYNLK